MAFEGAGCAGGDGVEQALRGGSRTGTVAGRGTRAPIDEWLLGQNMLDEVGGGFRHASRATAWTEAAALATEPHQLLVPAGIALHTQESVFEARAFQVRLELFDDEVGERDAFGIKAFEKPREVLLDEGVERGLLGAVTFVRGCVTGKSRSRAGGHLSSVVMGVGPGGGLF